MKKLAIGCAIVLVIGIIAVAGIGYYGYTKAKGMMAKLQELGQVADLEREVKNKSPFAVPDSRELTAAQLDRLVQVQTRVRERLGASGAAIERNYKSLIDKKEATVTDLPALLSAYGDMARALVDAKRAQVEALNDLNVSLEEYRWVRTESYRALGVPFVDMDVSRIMERSKSGGDPGVVSLDGAVGDKGPESNVKLVEKYRKQLEEYMALATFGL
jgi:hypothetical protein